MPFKKISPKQELEKRIKSDTEFAIEYEKAKKEYQDCKRKGIKFE